MKNNTLRDFSPRIGLAYDLFGNGKTAIRSGFGIYYDMGISGPPSDKTPLGRRRFPDWVDITNPPTGGGVVLRLLRPTAGSGFPFPIPDSILNSYIPRPRLES